MPYVTGRLRRRQEVKGRDTRTGHKVTRRDTYLLLWWLQEGSHFSFKIPGTEMGCRPQGNERLCGLVLWGQDCTSKGFGKDYSHILKARYPRCLRTMDRI